MAKKTIEDFRAERNMWRSQLADYLEMDEDSLEAIEKDGKEHRDIEAKIIERFKLPNDYFTFDPDAPENKPTPKKPFLYLFRTSFLWLLIFTVIRSVVVLPLRFSSPIGTNPNTFYNILAAFCSAVITLHSGIYLTSHITEKTSYTRKIRRYDYMYPFLITSFFMAVEPLSVYMQRVLLLQTGGEAKTVLAGVGLGLASVLIKSVFCAFILYSLAILTGGKQKKALFAVSAATVAGYAAYILLEVLLCKNTTLPFIVNTVCYGVLMLFSLVMLVVFHKKSKLNEIWFSASPILAMLVTPLSMVIMSFLE